MSGRGGFHVEGLREAIRDLEAAGVEIEDLKDAFAKVSNEARDQVAQHTPRRSGRLAAAARASRAKNKAIVTVGGARVPYAGPIFYGWGRRNIRASRTIERTDAVMEHEAPRILDAELGRIFTKYGFN
jgi:hypothetical protein